MNEREIHTLLLNAVAEGLAARIVLDELRSGRLASALELLERSLDTSVLTLRSLGLKAGPAEQGQVAAALRVLRDYRDRHPRKPEAVMDGDDKRELLLTQEKVREILHEAE